MSDDATPAQDSGRHLAESYLLLTATSLCWAGNAVLGRLAVGEVSPMMVVLGRWVGVLILCFVFLLPMLRRDWPVLKRHLPFLALLGATGFTGFNALFYLAAHGTTALNIGILQGTIPIFVLVGSFLIYRSGLRPMQGLGVVLTVTGVVTVSSGGSVDRLLALQFNPGDLLMLCACILYAGYTIALRNRPKVSPLSMFAVMAGAAFIVSLPAAGIEAALDRFQWPTPLGWLLIGLVTVFPSFIAQIFFIQGVDRIGPARAGVFVNLVPIFAAAMAVLFLKEAFHLYHAIALTLVLIGIYLSEKFKPT
ncbi:DMT family transporter [Pacificispira sp.]|uniref:DMT family transporter n=1 Tax=Pacificispira sp. TaxID=2888761 RepID=UPI003B524E0E